MWETNLLKLDTVYIGGDFPKNVVFADIVNDYFSLQMKNLCNQVRAVAVWFGKSAFVILGHLVLAVIVINKPIFFKYHAAAIASWYSWFI